MTGSKDIKKGYEVKREFRIGRHQIVFRSEDITGSVHWLGPVFFMPLEHISYNMFADQEPAQIKETIKENIQECKAPIRGAYPSYRGNIFFILSDLNSGCSFNTHSTQIIANMLTHASYFANALVIDTCAGDGVLVNIALGLGAKKVYLLDRYKLNLTIAEAFLEANGWRKDSGSGGDFIIKNGDIREPELYKKLSQEFLSLNKKVIVLGRAVDSSPGWFKRTKLLCGLPDVVALFLSTIYDNDTEDEESPFFDTDYKGDNVDLSALSKVMQKGGLKVKSSTEGLLVAVKGAAFKPVGSPKIKNYFSVLPIRSPRYLPSEGCLMRRIEKLTKEIYRFIREKGFYSPAARQAVKLESLFPYQISFALSEDRRFYSSITVSTGLFGNPAQDNNPNNIIFVLSPAWVKKHNDEFNLTGVNFKESANRTRYKGGLKKLGLNKHPYSPAVAFLGSKMYVAMPDEVQFEGCGDITNAIIPPEATFAIIGRQRKINEIYRWDEELGFSHLPAYVSDDDFGAEGTKPTLKLFNSSEKGDGSIFEDGKLKCSPLAILITIIVLAAWLIFVPHPASFAGGMGFAFALGSLESNPDSVSLGALYEYLRSYYAAKLKLLQAYRNRDKEAYTAAHNEIVENGPDRRKAAAVALGGCLRQDSADHLYARLANEKDTAVIFEIVKSLALMREHDIKPAAVDAAISNINTLKSTSNLKEELINALLLGYHSSREAAAILYARSKDGSIPRNVDSIIRSSIAYLLDRGITPLDIRPEEAAKVKAEVTAGFGQYGSSELTDRLRAFVGDREEPAPSSAPPADDLGSRLRGVTARNNAGSGAVLPGLGGRLRRPRDPDQGNNTKFILHLKTDVGLKKENSSSPASVGLVLVGATLAFMRHEGMPVLFREPLSDPVADKSEVTQAFMRSYFFKGFNLRSIKAQRNQLLFRLYEFYSNGLHFINEISDAVGIPKFALFFKGFEFRNFSFHRFLSPVIKPAFGLRHCPRSNDCNFASAKVLKYYGQITPAVSLPQSGIAVKLGFHNKWAVFKKGFFNFYGNNSMPADMRNTAFVPFDMLNFQSCASNPSIMRYTKDVKGNLILAASLASSPVYLSPQLPTLSSIPVIQVVNKSDLGFLRTQVERSAGKVIYCSHPLFTRARFDKIQSKFKYSSEEMDALLRKYDYFIDQVLGYLKMRCQPVFVTVPEISQRQREAVIGLFLKAQVYSVLVFTTQYSPTPNFGFRNNWLNNWARLEYIFRDLGIKEIELIGEENLRDPRDGCIGWTQTLLGRSRYFEVLINERFTFPDGEEVIRRRSLVAGDNNDDYKLAQDSRGSSSPVSMPLDKIESILNFITSHSWVESVLAYIDQWKSNSYILIGRKRELGPVSVCLLVRNLIREADLQAISNLFSEKNTVLRRTASRVYYDPVKRSFSTFYSYHSSLAGAALLGLVNRTILMAIREKIDNGIFKKEYLGRCQVALEGLHVGDFLIIDQRMAVVFIVCYWIRQRNSRIYGF